MPATTTCSAPGMAAAVASPPLGVTSGVEARRRFDESRLRRLERGGGRRVRREIGIEPREALRQAGARGVDATEEGVELRDAATRVDERLLAVIEAALVLGRRGRDGEVAGELVDALPTIEHAVTMVSPLEGAVERLGRTIDRLPGGRAKASARRMPEPLPETESHEPGSEPR